MRTPYANAPKVKFPVRTNSTMSRPPHVSALPQPTLTHLIFRAIRRNTGMDNDKESAAVHIGVRRLELELASRSALGSNNSLWWPLEKHLNPHPSKTEGCGTRKINSITSGGVESHVAV
jgi:hypothetical protein